MRIGVVTGTFHPETGGPATYLHDLCGDLVDRGHDVVVTTYGDDAPDRYPYRVVRVSRTRLLPIRLLSFALAALRTSRDRDVLYVNDYGLPSALLNTYLRKPLVMKVVGDFAWEYSIRHGLVDQDMTIDAFQSLSKGPHVRLLKRTQAFYTRRASTVIVPSSYLRSLLLGWGVRGERVCVIPNAAKLPAGEEEAAVLRVDRLARPLPLSPALVTIARLVPWKGVDEVIGAIKTVLALFPQASLWIVGDGPDRTRLESLARQSGVSQAVHFVGRVERMDVLRFLRAADVCVLYSGYEGLSHVLLEAMAVGCAVVASAAGGNVELITDGVNGVLVPYGDRDALADALCTVLGDSDLRERLGGAARASVSPQAWGALLDATERVLAEAAAGR